jgi:hypothetical protein
MRQTVTLTSDILLAFENSAYKEPSRALREFTDNSCIGLYNPFIKVKRKIELNFYVNPGEVIPNRIGVWDNGIGMTDDTVFRAFYGVLQASGKTEQGGTSRHGLGVKQAVKYLGDYGKVITFPLNGTKGSISTFILQSGAQPERDYDYISKEEFMSIHPIFENGHGTMVEIVNINQDKWDKNWWTTTSSTKYLRLLSRIYRNLLERDELEITAILHKDGKTIVKNLQKADIPLDNGTIDTDSTIDYLNSGRNHYNAKNIKKKLQTIDTTITLNIGKTLKPSEKDCWGTFTHDNLYESKPTDFANGTISILQNSIEISSHKLKKSDREIGLMHLNGLFVTVEFPNNVELPTTTIKDDIQETLKNEIVEIVIEEAEKIWKPTNENDEFRWHKKFKEIIYGNTILGQAIRDKYFGGITHDEAKEQIKHEYQLGIDRPDFQWVTTQLIDSGDTIQVCKVIFELKPMDSKSEDCAQLAKYWMSYPNTEKIILLAQTHSIQVTNTIPEWNTNRNANFELLTYDELNISLN